jgi:hypothetical protein
VKNCKYFCTTLASLHFHTQNKEEEEEEEEEEKKQEQHK